MKLFKKHNAEDWNHYNPLKYVTTFSKCITFIWLFLFAETILFSQVATVMSWGDAMAIQYINDTVKSVGENITIFYFSSKAIENVAQGYEEWKLKMLNSTSDNSDEDTVPIE